MKRGVRIFSKVGAASRERPGTSETLKDLSAYIATSDQSKDLAWLKEISTILTPLINAKMSGKIRGKDLSYDSSLPPFLQRLHDQNAARGDTDRHERPTVRSRVARDPNEDDGPTIVDESGELLDKDEFENLAKSNTADSTAGGNVTGEIDSNAEPKASGALPNGSDGPKRDKNVTEGITQKKRKFAKVIGDDNVVPADESTDKSPTVNKAAKKIKKKAKPIKLAFDEDEGP